MHEQYATAARIWTKLSKSQNLPFYGMTITCISVKNKPGFVKFTIFSKTKPIFAIYCISKFTKYGKQAINFYIYNP